LIPRARCASDGQTRRESGGAHPLGCATALVARSGLEEGIPVPNRVFRGRSTGLLAALALCQAYLLWRYALSAGNGSGAPLQLMPFSTIESQLRMVFESPVPEVMRIGVVQLAGNLLLMSPLGALLAAPTRVRWSRAVIAITCSAVLLETYQWFAKNGRTSDVDDVILNSSGALATYAAFRLARCLIQRRRTALELRAVAP